MRASLIISATLASALRCPILRVGRPLLPLDAIGYGIPPAVFDQIVSEAEDPSAVVIGLQHRDAAAGTLCVLDATRAENDGGRARPTAWKPCSLVPALLCASRGRRNHSNAAKMSSNGARMALL